MNKEILRLSIPNILTNITVPLLGMVDLAVLGHLGSVDYLGSVALGSIIFSFIYSIFSFLRMGTSGFTAQYYGEGNKEEMILTLSRALLVALAISGLLLMLQVPLEKLSFLLIGNEKGENIALESLARNYFYIRIWAAPATLGLYVMYGWFIGMQNAIIPMIIALTVNILNVTFNLIFVYIFDMTSDGVALGTVLAQYIGFILGILLFFKKYRYLIEFWDKKKMLLMDKLKIFISVNRDIFIRSISIMLVISFFTAYSYNTDKNTLAVNTLLLQYFFIFSYFIDGFAYAAEALTGKYIGAKDSTSLKNVIKLLFKWGFFLSIPFTIAYVIFGENLIKLLTSEQFVIKSAMPYLPWLGVIPLISFASFLWDGIYAGATASKGLRNSMLIATFIFFFPTYFLTRDILGNHSLWLALVLFLAARGVFQTIFAKKEIFKKVRT